MELLQSLQIHPNLANAVPGRITGQIPSKPQHPHVWLYDPAIRSSMILPLAPPSSWLNPLSHFISLSVSCLCRNTSVFSPPIDLSFITLGKEKTLISLSLKVNKQLDHFNYFRIFFLYNWLPNLSLLHAITHACRKTFLVAASLTMLTNPRAGS